MGYINNEQKGSKMKPSELFALALRIIGIIGLAYIARAFVRVPSPPVLVLVGRVVSILVAAYFLRGGRLLVKLAYPTSPQEPAEHPELESHAEPLAR